MKKGDTAHCPRCGEKTVVKITAVMDGWTKTGDIYSCTLCGGELGKVDPAPAAAPPTPQSDRLSSLLGETLDHSTRLTRTADDGILCSNCRHFIAHPFQNRCGKFDRPADPTADCPAFARKAEDSGGKAKTF